MDENSLAWVMLTNPFGSGDNPDEPAPRKRKAPASRSLGIDAELHNAQLFMGSRMAVESVNVNDLPNHIRAAYLEELKED